MATFGVDAVVLEPLSESELGHEDNTTAWGLCSDTFCCCTLPLLATRGAWARSRPRALLWRWTYCTAQTDPVEPSREDRERQTVCTFIAKTFWLREQNCARAGKRAKSVLGFRRTEKAKRTRREEVTRRHRCGPCDAPPRPAQAMSDAYNNHDGLHVRPRVGDHYQSHWHCYYPWGGAGA